MSGKRKAPAKKSAARKQTAKQKIGDKISEAFAKSAPEVIGDNDPVTEKRELIPEPPDKLPDPVDGSKAQKKLVGE